MERRAGIGACRRVRSWTKYESPPTPWPLEWKAGCWIVAGQRLREATMRQASAPLMALPGARPGAGGPCAPWPSKPPASTH
jgi:hypothetical protein